MANLPVLDGASVSKYLKASGAGTDLDPHVVEHAITDLSTLATEVTLAAVLAALGDEIEVIAFEHGQVHRGRMWHLSYRIESLANNASLDIVLSVGAQRAHTVIQAHGGADAWSILYEGPTLSAAGTALTIHNMKRGTAGIPALAATHTPTVTTTGIELDAVLLPGGSGSGSQGAGVRREVEWVLAANTVYLLRHTNIGGNSQPASVAVEFYEEA